MAAPNKAAENFQIGDGGKEKANNASDNLRAGNVPMTAEHNDIIGKMRLGGTDGKELGKLPNLDIVDGSKERAPEASHTVTGTRIVSSPLGNDTQYAVTKGSSDGGQAKQAANVTADQIEQTRAA